MKEKKPYAIAVSLYFLLSILLTWPLLFNLSSTLFGDWADARGEVWTIWAKINGYFKGESNPLTSAPFGDFIDLGFSQPITEWSHLILAKFTNEVMAHNLIVLFAFPTTALTTFILIDYLIKNKLAAFLGGMQFGFAPAAVMQAAGGHSSLSFNMFVPLFILALFNNRKERSFKSAALVGLTYAMIVFTAMYMGYFALYIVLFFLILDIYQTPKKQRLKIFFNAAQGGLTAIVLVLPFVYKRVFGQIGGGDGVTGKAWRDFSELEVYSARPWEYLLPSVDHPIFGPFVYNFTKAHLHGSNIPEQTLYLGVIPISLVVIGIYFLIKNKLEHKKYFLFFSFAAFFAFLLSLPPVIKIGKLMIPNISSLVYQIAPMFRVYSRFGILVNLFVAVAAAIVISELCKRYSKGQFKKAAVVLALILAFEYWSVPPNYANPVYTPPAYATWLASQPGDFIIAEYPMMRWEDLAFYTYKFWQRVHKKPMVNGAAPFNSKAWEFYQQVFDLEKPETLPLLRSIGAKYIVIHKKVYDQGPVPDPIKRHFSEEYRFIKYHHGKLPKIPAGLKLVFKSEDELIFEI